MGMTREEAIEILEEVSDLDDSIYAYNHEYGIALRMAINALQGQEIQKEEQELGRWQEWHTKARGYGKIWYQHCCAPFLYESPYYYRPHCGMKMSEKRIKNE